MNGRIAPTRRFSQLAAVSSLPVALIVAGGVGRWWAVVAAAAVVLVVVALVDAVLAVSPVDLVIERTAPGALVRGEEGTLRWIVTNPSSRGLEFALADTVAPSLGLERRCSGRLGPRASLDIERPFRPSRRGRFEIGPLTVRCAGPLGLAARQRDIDDVDVVRVLPPFYSRRAIELRMRSRRFATAGLRSTRGRGGGTEFEQLREYVPGDDPRHIDWNATARSDRPIVRTFNIEQHQPITIMLDCGRTMAALVGGAPRIEHAMDAAVAFSVVASRMRDRVSFVAYDQVVRGEVGQGAGAQLASRVTEALFALEPALVAADYSGALVTATQAQRRRSLIVLLTELNESVVEEHLAPAVAQHVLSHHVVVAAIADPGLRDMADRPIRDREDLHLAAAATRELAARERAGGLLSDLGVTVIDAPPGDCATQLVDAYLDLKASGSW